MKTKRQKPIEVRFDRKTKRWETVEKVTTNAKNPDVKEFPYLVLFRDTKTGEVYELLADDGKHSRRFKSRLAAEAYALVASRQHRRLMAVGKETAKTVQVFQDCPVFHFGEALNAGLGLGFLALLAKGKIDETPEENAWRWSAKVKTESVAKSTRAKTSSRRRAA